MKAIPYRPCQVNSRPEKMGLLACEQTQYPRAGLPEKPYITSLVAFDSRFPSYKHGRR